MKVLFFIFLLISNSLGCQNYCSGHGECSTGERCDCFPGWGGSECNLRSCPYGEAFVDLLPGDLDHDGTISPGVDGDSDLAKRYHLIKNEWNPYLGTAEAVGLLIKDTGRAHRYAECSNAGICNRENGLCVCNNGFEGSACQRRSCPASSDGLVCSGHGMCLTSEESIIRHPPTTTPPAAAALPSGWEYQKFGVCECDKGWTGISCGSRICPKGLDPVTKGSYIYTFTITPSSDSLFDSSDGLNSHYYEMVYDGITYKSPIIPALTGICDSSNKLVSSVASEAAEEIRRALVSIPPLSQSKVSFTCDTTTAKKLSSIIISTPYIELDLKTVANQNCQSPNPTTNTPYSCTIKHGSANDVPLITESKPSLFDVYKVDGSSAAASITLKMTSTSMNVDFKNGASTVTPIEDSGVISCSGRGNCDAASGLCECFDGYAGVACEKQRNN